jgi:hypothetical protein
MDNTKFEILLREDRNWLSKYGGFLSLIIIVILIFGVFWIKVPEYEYLKFSKKNTPFIEVNKDQFVGKIGDPVMIDNHIINDMVLIIDRINNNNNNNNKDLMIIYFKSTNVNLSKKNLRIITHKKSLLKSLLNPLLPNKGE